MDNFKILNKFKKGFTLVELLVVVSILTFLMVLIVAYFRTQIFKGNDAKKKGDIHRILIGFEEYEKDHDCYPPKALIEQGCNPGRWLMPYLDKIPCDNSKTKAPYNIEVEEASCPSWYRIYTNLDNTKDSDISKLGCTYGCGLNYTYNFYASSTDAPAVLKGSAATTYTPGSTVSSNPECGYNIWGCINGSCVPISWNEQCVAQCSPNYSTNDCNSRCSDPSKECQ